MTKAIVESGDLIDLTAVRRALDGAMDDGAAFAENAGKLHNKNHAQTDITKKLGFRRVEFPNKIFRFVDHGTSAHVIRIRTKRALKFNRRYRRGTTPGRIRGGRGQSGGGDVFAKEVRHPGSKPSRFSDTLKREMDVVFPIIIDDALSKAIK